jgi:hypothetical protein
MPSLGQGGVERTQVGVEDDIKIRRGIQGMRFRRIDHCHVLGLALRQPEEEQELSLGEDPRLHVLTDIARILVGGQRLSIARTDTVPCQLIGNGSSRHAPVVKVVTIEIAYKWLPFLWMRAPEDVATNSLRRRRRIRLLYVPKARTIRPSNFSRFGLLTLLTSESGLLSVPE